MVNYDDKSMPSSFSFGAKNIIEDLGVHDSSYVHMHCRS